MKSTLEAGKMLFNLCHISPNLQTPGHLANSARLPHLSRLGCCTFYCSGNFADLHLYKLYKQNPGSSKWYVMVNEENLMVENHVLKGGEKKC